MLSFDLPTPLAFFGTLVQSDKDFPLLEAASSLAQDEYPGADIQHVLGEVDRLAVRLKYKISADAPALQRLRSLNNFFYRELNFSGNINNFYDPDNSFLSEVIRTRKGIPISLAVLWLEMAQSIGLQARGVSFPGHFMVKVSLPNGQVVIDPFTGHSLSREELTERLEPFKRKSGLVGEFDVPLSLYLQAEEPRQIIARMLRNLQEIYRSQEDWARFVRVQNRLLVLLPKAWNEYRDRGLALAELGRTSEAVVDLETYLSRAGEGLDLDAIAERTAELRKTLS